MSDAIDNLVRQWTTLGAGFGAEPAVDTPDIERLLLDTARLSPKMSRLFVMAATWLNIYGDLVAKHRLKRLIRDELKAQSHPILGLLLDEAQRGTHPLEFESIIKDLRPASTPYPLFESERRSDALVARARRRASEISRRWNLWCEPIEFKTDAVRPASWFMSRHPQLIQRADFRGDLRASVVAALRFDPGAGESESRLAELAGGSRAQVRSALRNLEMTGRVISRRVQGANRREVLLIDAA